MMPAGPVRALRKVDLTVKDGEFLSIMGPSGSGKTTLLNIIGALDYPTQGTVFLNGVDIADLSEGKRSRIRLEEIGFVFQQFYLLPSLTALQNVHLPIREVDGFGNKGKKKAEDLLEKLGILERKDHLPSQLSGGEQQRVAIARALANDPSVVLADEPTGELDSGNSKAILDILKDLNRNDGITVIIVTHDSETAKRSKRNIKMRDGRIQK
jgi:putative ABC transport system ATP-binding protein